MKLLQIPLLVLLVNFAFTQEVQNVTLKEVEYVWERQAGDNRIVVAKDSAYQKMLKASIANGIAGKWNIAVPSFDLKVIKLPSLRSQPKFTTLVSNADSTKRYLFLQFYDASIPINANNTSFSARINVKYRLIAAGAENTDRYVSYKVFRRNPQPGQTVIYRFPFLATQFKLLCDTIVNSILHDETENEKEIWLDPACGYDEEHQISNPVSFRFSNNRQSITVSGDNGFSMLLDSVTEERTGKVKHGVGNTAGTLLTFFSNIDTDKKRSARYLANRTYSEGSTTYHAYISYVDSKVAERRRVKDEDGNKSIETGDYYQRWKEINPFAKHLITLNGDTVSLFNIEFRLKEDHFTKMWNGKDPDTVDSLPPAFNNFARFEMEMKGNIDDSTFILTTSGEGHIKRISINGNDAMTFYSNGEPDGVLSHRNLNERQFKIVTLLCLLSDQYFQYK